MNIANAFTQYNVNFPVFDEVSKKEKESKDYNLKVCQAIYSCYLNDDTALRSSVHNEFEILRLYGAGNQPEDWYKTYMSGGSGVGAGNISVSSGVDTIFTENKEAYKKGFLNVDWSIRSLMPKIKSVLLPKIKNIDYDLRVNIIDQFSGAEEEDAMNRAIARINFGEITDSMRKEHGLPVPEDDLMASNWQDLQRMQSEGYFKPAHAKASEKIARHTEDISFWDETLYEKLINDAIDVGTISAVHVFDKEIGKCKWEYIKPEYVIMQYSDHKDFRDSEFGGYFRFTTISNLKQRYPEVDELDWRSIAKRYQGQIGNKTIKNWEYVSNDTGRGYIYDNFVVAEMPSYWMDVEKDERLKYTTTSGKTVYYPMDEKMMKKNPRMSYHLTRKRVLYHAVWIVGSDLIFDYGKAENQARPEMTKPMIPIFMYKFGYNSITKRLKPVMDDYQIINLHAQNVFSTATHGGISIDVGMIDNISDGNKEYSVADVIKMYIERGVLLHQTSIDGGYHGGATNPIQSIQGTFESQLAAYINVRRSCVEQVEELTGISPVALGATPGSSQPVGTTEMSYNATMDSFRHIVDACKYVKGLLGTCTIETLRVIFKASEKIKGNYAAVVSMNDVESIVNAKRRGIQYGMKMIARATDLERQSLMENAKEAKMKRAQGQAGLNEGQYYEILHMLDSGSSLKQIADRMQYLIDKDAKRINEEAMAKIKEQNQGLQQMEQQKAQSQMQMEQQKSQAQMQIIQQQQQYEQMKHKQELERIKFEYDQKIRLAIAEAKAEDEKHRREMMAKYNSDMVKYNIDMAKVEADLQKADQTSE